MHERFNQDKSIVSKEIYRGFELTYPMISERVSEWYDIGYNRIIVILSNNEVYEYDDMYNTIRKLHELDNFGYEQGDEEYYKNNFARKLDTIMQYRGFRQSTLAEACGTSQVMISNYITGKSIPTYYMLIKIAKALRCSLDELV